MKITDIQTALLQDKEALFRIRSERWGFYFVIDSFETVAEEVGRSWKRQTRNSTFAIGRLVHFNERLVEVATSPRRYRLNQIEEVVTVPDGVYTLSAWTAWEHECHQTRIDRNLAHQSDIELFTAVLLKELGLDISRSDAEGLSATFRESLIKRLTTVTA